MSKKITVIITDANDKKLRDYIVLHFPQETYGKLSLIVDRAIGYYLTHHR